MKKEYVTPIMYSEEFVPNAYAAGCAPGIDETDPSVAPAYKETCYYLHNGWTSCSGIGTDLWFFLEKNSACKDVTLKADGSAGTRGGIYIGTEEFEVIDGEERYTVEKPAYIWSNGTWFGAHYIPVSELGGQINGKPKYFVS